MTLATRPFGNLFAFSRNSTKWEMGPNGKFIEYPVHAPAYRHDPVTGNKLGVSINEGVTTLQGYSLGPYSSGNFDSLDVESLFKGKTAKKVRNISSSNAAGQSYILGQIPDRGATGILYVEFTSTPKTAFGFRDQDAGIWQAAYTFNPSTESFVHYSGSVPVTFGALRLLSSGPNGGPVYMIWMTILEQLVEGNRISFTHYPAFEDDSFPDPRESIIHYVGVIDYPYPQMSPIWVDGTNLTRPTDFCVIDPIPTAVSESPRTVIAEMVLDSPAVGVLDSSHGGVGFVESGGAYTDRAWILMRGTYAESPRSQVVSGITTAPQFAAPSIDNDHLIRACMAWDSSTVAFCSNGTYFSAESSAGVPFNNRRRLQIGHAISSNRIMNGLIKKIRVVNELWSQERMEQETAA